MLGCAYFTAQAVELGAERDRKLSRARSNSEAATTVRDLWANESGFLPIGRRQRVGGHQDLEH